MTSPISFVRRHLSFVGAGITDRVFTRTTGKKFSFARHVAAKLNNCEPWTDHFERPALTELSKAYKLGDFNAMRIFAGLGVAEGASPHCVGLAHMAIELLAEGSEIVIELAFLE